MELFIDNHSGVPIYQQIVEQVTRQVYSGALPKDSPLPSIRNLAKDLRISVITTKRAYEELEQAGLIYTLPGKGSFVMGQSAAAVEERNRFQIEEQLRILWQMARKQGIDRETFRLMLDLIMEDEQ